MRRELLDAALELFASNGFHGTSLRDLARAVGVRESAIYHYFGSKDALLDAVVSEPFATPALPFGVEAAWDGGDPRVLLEGLAEALLARMSTLREIKRFRLLLGDGLRLAAEGRLDFWARTGLPRERLAALFGQLMQAGVLRKADPEFAVVAFMSPLLFWRILQVASPRSGFVEQPKRFVRLHVAQFLDGAGAPPGRTES